MGYPRPLFPISASHNLNLLKVSRLLPVKYKRKDCTPIFFKAFCENVYPNSTVFKRRNEPSCIHQVLVTILLSTSVGDRRGQNAYIGGCAGTACTLTDELYQVPASGTMAHAWVQMFDSEYEAFKAYCEIYPHNAVLLVDTYNTLKSGVPNAIRVFKEMLVPQGITNFAIRLDSGDISYLSKQARKMLDEAGLTNCKIVASNALDEHLIRDLLMQGAKVDVFGVGERMITSKSAPVFGGVYKLVAIENENGEITPKIKLSENISKITNPHFKKVYRLYDKETGKAIADELCLYDETIDTTKEHTIFDPNATWKQKTLTNFTARELQVPIFKNGECVYESPSIEEIKAYCQKEVETLWDEVKRFENPHRYYVDLSQKLWDIKKELCVKNAMKSK